MPDTAVLPPSFVPDDEVKLPPSFVPDDAKLPPSFVPDGPELPASFVPDNVAPAVTPIAAPARSSPPTLGDNPVQALDALDVFGAPVSRVGIPSAIGISRTVSTELDRLAARTPEQIEAERLDKLRAPEGMFDQDTYYLNRIGSDGLRTYVHENFVGSRGEVRRAVEITHVEWQRAFSAGQAFSQKPHPKIKRIGRINKQGEAILVPQMVDFPGAAVGRAVQVGAAAARDISTRHLAQIGGWFLDSDTLRDWGRLRQVDLVPPSQSTGEDYVRGLTELAGGFLPFLVPTPMTVLGATGVRVANWATKLARVNTATAEGRMAAWVARLTGGLTGIGAIPTAGGLASGELTGGEALLSIGTGGVGFLYSPIPATLESIERFQQGDRQGGVAALLPVLFFAHMARNTVRGAGDKKAAIAEVETMLMDGLGMTTGEAKRVVKELERQFKLPGGKHAALREAIAPFFAGKDPRDIERFMRRSVTEAAESAGMPVDEFIDKRVAPEITPAETKEQPKPKVKPKKEPKVEAEARIGDNRKVMGTESTLAKTETIGGVRYELYNDARLIGKGGAIRVVDIESGEVVTTKRHPLFDNAEAEYNKAVALAAPSIGRPAEPSGKDVTTRRLNEIVNGPVIGTSSEQFKMRSFIRKKSDAPITKTEQRVMDLVSVPKGGIDLGFTSTALVYGPGIRGWTLAQKKALLSLLDRGRLKVVERLVDNKPNEFIVEKRADAEITEPKVGTKADFELAELGTPRPRPSGTPSAEFDKRIDGDAITPYGVSTPKIDPKDVVSPKQIRDLVGKHGFPVTDRPFSKRRTTLGYFDVNTESIHVREANDIASVVHETGHAITLKMFGIGKMYGKDQALRKELIEAGNKLYGDNPPKGGKAVEGEAEFFSWLMMGEPGQAQELMPLAYAKFHQKLAEFPQIRVFIKDLRDLSQKYKDQGFEARVYGAFDHKMESKKTLFAQRVNEFRFKSQDIVTSIRALEKKATTPVKKGGAGFRVQTPDIKMLPADTEAGIKQREKLILADRSPAFLAQLLSGSAGKQIENAVTGDGWRDAFGKPMPGNPGSLKQILAPVGDQVTEWYQFVVSMRTLEAYERGKVGLTIRKADAEKFVAKHKDNQVWMKAAKDVTAWADTGLRYAVQSGALSAEAAAAMREAWPIYLPMVPVGPGTTAGGKSPKTPAGQQKVVGRFAESGMELLNPIATLIKHNYDLIRISNQKIIWDAIVELADRVPTNGLVTRVADQDVRNLKSTSVTIGEIRKKVKKHRLEIKNQSDPNKELSDDVLNELVTFYSIGKQYFGKEPIVPHVSGDGEVKFYRLEPGIHEVVVNGADSGFMSGLLRVLSKPSQHFKLGTTALNPAFIGFRNPAKDLPNFFVHSQGTFVQSAQGLFYGWWKANVDMMLHQTGVKPSEEIARLKARGLEVATTLGYDLGNWQKIHRQFNGNSKVTNLVRNFPDFLRKTLSIPEMSSVLTEYRILKKRAVRAGMTDSEADVYAYHEALLLLPYARRGQYTRWVEAGIPYFNAQLQGKIRTLELVSRNPKKFVPKAIAMFTIPHLANWWANKDKQEWKDLLPWQKGAYLNIDNPWGDRFLTKPSSHETEVFFGNLPVILLDQWWQENRQSLIQELGPALDQLNPVPILKAGTIAAPEAKFIAMELASNNVVGGIVSELSTGINAFTKAPTLPRRLENVPAHQRYSQRTTEIAKMVSRKLHSIGIEMSPVTMETIVDGWTGRTATRGIKLMEEDDGKRDFLHYMGIAGRGSLYNQRLREAWYSDWDDLSRRHNGKLRMRKGDPVVPWSTQDDRAWAEFKLIKSNIDKLTQERRRLMEKGSDTDKDMILWLHQAQDRLMRDSMIRLDRWTPDR